MSGFLDERAGLAGKTAVVVGGATGIGGAISLDLARAGVDVAIFDVDATALAETHGRVEELGRFLLGVAADARDPEAVAAFFAEVDGVADRLDILVNVVGGVRQAPFMDTTPETWRRDAEWNYEYALHTTRHAVERMRRIGQGGSIVNITTIESHRAAPTFAVYAGYKAALTNFSRSVAVELGAEGIRVNCVAVESIPTPNVVKVRPQGTWTDPSREDDLRGESYKMYVPLQRPGTTEEVSNVVLFLASSLSSFTTGTSIHVDGGAWASSGWTRWPEDGFLPRPGNRAVERLFPPEADR